MLYCDINDAFDNNINKNYVNTFNINSINDNKSENSLQKFVKKEINIKPVLTHRQCIDLYLNPDNAKNPELKMALVHIRKCPICKNTLQQKFSNNNKIIDNKNIKEDMQNTDEDSQDEHLKHLNIINKQNKQIAQLYAMIKDKKEQDNFKNNPLMITLVIIGIILIIDIIIKLRY